MGLDFYIGNDLESIDFKSESVEFEEKFQNYLYQIRDNVSFDVQPLYGTDPYDDTAFDEEAINRIIEACDNLLKSDILKKFNNSEEGKETIVSIKSICEKALKKKEKVFSIGD